MDEMTFDQPLATLAVAGVVTVLVVPEPPKCTVCGGHGKIVVHAIDRWWYCETCDGDGLARWPAEVTIRSTTKEPEITNGGAWDVWRHMDGEFALVRDRHFVQFLPLGHVLGSVTVEAAVPILGVDDIIEESCGWVSVFHRSAYLLLQSESGEHRHSDISDQIAFQDFHPGHTALILGGETDA